MKKFNYLRLSLLLFLFGFSISIFAQEKTISKDEAWKIVQKKVLSNKLTDLNVYIGKSELLPDALIKSAFKEITAPNFVSWFFFIDEIPLANWRHPCKYVFVNSKSGELEIKNEIFPPNIDEMEALIEYKPSPGGKLFNFKKLKESTKNVCSNNNDYAVIISGGVNSYNNNERYWNDCSAIYSALVYLYHYNEDHIYVLMSDGTSSANDRHLISGGYDSSPLDLDGDEDNDIEYSATATNISTVFNELASILDSEDNFIYFCYRPWRFNFRVRYIFKSLEQHNTF